jgi:hypothetical protein
VFSVEIYEFVHAKVGRRYGFDTMREVECPKRKSPKCNLDKIEVAFDAKEGPDMEALDEAWLTVWTEELPKVPFTPGNGDCGRQPSQHVCLSLRSSR